MDGMVLWLAWGLILWFLCVCTAFHYHNTHSRASLGDNANWHSIHEMCHPITATIHPPSQMSVNISHSGDAMGNRISEEAKRSSYKKVEQILICGSSSGAQRCDTTQL